jgi:hypothetical protein|tara:strand:- start:3286 stop:4155 length:870 start_codon:yes stop_codon:yes gene_type:complete
MFLSVVACFKDESHILEEWINHYIDQGVDQFILCDNNSTDDYQSILDKYDNIILYKDSYKDIQWDCTGTKGKYGLNIYSKMLTEHKTDWAVICDPDEFMYAREGYDTIREFLKERGSEFDQLIVPNILIHHKSGTDLVIKKQPKSVVDTFIYGCKEDKNIKSIVKVDSVVRLKIHEHVVKGRSTRPHLKDTFFLTPKTSNSMYGTLKKYPEGGWRHYPEEGKVYVHCNHYRFQSEEYFLNIKSKKTYADRDNDEAEKKMHRMQDWWGANGKDYIIDTELRDKKNGIKGI